MRARGRLCLAVIFGLAAPACGADRNAAETATGDYPRVLLKRDFDRDTGGFRAAREARITTTEDAVSERALLCRPREPWAGAELDIDITGSKDLKIAFLAKGLDYPRAWLNVFDRIADDNTTSKAPRLLSADRWTPVVYRLERFRYNSRRSGTVAEETEYRSLRFFLSEPTDRSELLLDNLVIYRGDDHEPPGRVDGVTGSADRQGVHLQWPAASDNVGVMGYVVSRRRGSDGPFDKVGETPEPRWIDSGAPAGKLAYRVLAVDFERNLGPWSDAIHLESAVARQPRPPTPEEMRRADFASRVREVHGTGRGRVRKGHVCLFGDSLTRATAYQRLAESALGIFTVSAQGFARKKTDFGRDKVAEVLAEENPEFLFVLFGTNNLRGRREPEAADLAEWMADLEAIARAAHHRGTVVILGTVPPRGFDDPDSGPQAAFNREVHALGQRIGVPVARIFEELQSAGDRRALLAADGIHWQPEGMAAAARAWARALEEVEWVLRDR